MFELTYIFHDCFLLRTPECCMVFDYWKDPLSGNSDLPRFLRFIPGDKPLYVFVSHFHKDHFNKDIFKWVNIHPDIRFIISKDTARHARYLLQNESLYKGERPDASLVTVLSKSESYSDDIIDVDAFGSTDVGNSYVIRLKSSGLRVFHAGDLNCWTWRDESAVGEIHSEEMTFRSELEPIAKKYPELDVAMFPVDSRIGTGFAQGASEFVRKINVKRFFPMHFTLGDSDEEREKRREDAVNFDLYSASQGEYVALTAPGDRYEFSSEDLSDFDDMSGNALDNVVDKKVYTREYFLSAGEANAEGELSLPTLTAKLIDISTEHANSMGIGNPDMPNDHCGWVLSRLTIELMRFPKVDSDYTISTWVESWNRHFSERSYAIADESGNEIGYARSIWMVLDTETRANAGLDSLHLNPEYICGRECPIRRQGKHVVLLPPAEKPEGKMKYVEALPDVGVHRFGYSDLDAYRHVNTIRYVALLMDQYSLGVHDSKRVGRLELSFLHEGGYGRKLDILRAELPSEGSSIWNAIELRDSESLTPVLFARLRFDE